MVTVCEKNLVPEEQFGFMSGCSTTHQLLRLTAFVTSGFETKQSTVATLLDISKAYDTTWHTNLVYKLIAMQVPGHLINIINSFLTHPSFRVKVDGAYSEWKPILARIPQGSVLSPMLYNLYTADLSRSVVGLGGLEVTCSPRDPSFAGLNPAEVDGFFQGVKILSTSPPGGTFKLVKEPQA